MVFTGRIPSFLASLCAAGLLLSAAPLFAAENIPLARQLTEPLTTPKGQNDMGLGLDVVEKQDGSGWYVYPAAYLRHGITDNLELLPLGARYRFWNDKKNEYQMAAKARIAGVGDSRQDEAFYSVEGAVEGKWRAAPELSVVWSANWYRTIYTSGTVVDVVEPRAGILVSMGKYIAAEFTFGHDFIAGLHPTDLDTIGLTVFWNVAPEAAMTFSTATNFLPPNDSFRTYGVAGTSQVFTFGVRWTF